MPMFSRKSVLILLFVLSATFISFFPSLFNDFTTWDDPYYVMDNAEIKSLDWKNIKVIFTSTASASYLPLVTLSYAVEYHFFGLNPFVFHLTNLLLHLAVTGLVFWLAVRMSLNVWAAGLAALLFGIHPMHVESVAWVTERKDVLYSTFYMLALHSYWSYLERGKKRFYLLAIVWGVLGMMAKPMALSLPLILFVLDWMNGRVFSWKLLADKIPHFAYAVGLALITYLMHNDPVHVPIMEGALTWIWCSVFYVWKFLWPAVLAPLYSRPEPVSLLNPVYAAAVLSFAACVLLLIRFYKHRWFIFAWLFYGLSIFFLFRVDESEFNIVADRYMYLPSVGFCFLFGFFVHHAWEKGAQKFRRWLTAAVVILFAVLSVLTFRQCGIWKDGMTLMSAMIHRNPDSWFVLYNRGRAYEDQGRIDLALADYDRVIKIKPDQVWAYNNRGVIFIAQGYLDKALQDLSKAIELAPETDHHYTNRALIFIYQRKYELALADLEKAQRLKPDSLGVYVNQGLALREMKQYELEAEAYTRALQFHPESAQMFYYRSLAYANLGRAEAALQDALQAQILGWADIEKYIQYLKQHMPSDKGISAAR